MSAATTPMTAGAYVRRAATSSLGAKVVMAASGLLFYGWLILHMMGNLALFAGRETENKYAHFLHSTPELLWAQRIGLFLVVVAHVVTGIRLALLNRAARPQPYASPRSWRQATLASRTMALTGLVVLAFVIFHLLHFTGGVVFPRNFAQPYGPEGMLDVYGMVARSFAVPGIALIYVVAMGVIGFHLSHAVWSATQTLGLTGPKWTPFARLAGLVLGVGVATVFCLIPLAGLFGIIRP